ncbi:TonB-dependent receptor [Belliella sp. DSM 111904]|uniref:TonB-dependent receptor n=1 Tax=Belliella filtrata TaxID=2923435 RepID=A0ABS9V0D0_9BACT|nr:TonB-dependent receptor [Belliella filtrata]MCH7409783.1 TonB-dependent receptor [Belliella filtrata]
MKEKILPTQKILKMPRSFWIYCLIGFQLLYFPTIAREQDKNLEQTFVSLNLKKATIQEFFESIESKTDFRFAFDHRAMQSVTTLDIQAKDRSLLSVLEEISGKASLNFKQIQQTLHVSKVNNPTKKIPTKPVQAEIKITGTILNDIGEPLPGATVILEGNTSVGTVTDIDGAFSLEVPEDGVLVVSYIGFQTQRVPVMNRSVIHVSLESDVSALEEFIVVGYGTQQRLSVVGAVDQVGQEVFEGRPSATVSQALQGVSSNLIIQQTNSEPGAGVNLNIRGVSTLGDNSPLIVIDGIIGGDINLLNPLDIESVTVLKDAGSAAIYGSRANNGVVLITTKKGKKNMKPTVTYNGLLGVNEPHFFTSPVSGYQNAMLRNESAFNSGQNEAVFTPEQIRQFQANGDEQWFANEIFQSAMQQNHNFSVAGGGENSTYLVSVGFLDQQNNYVGPAKGYKRYNYRLNMTNEYGKFKLTSMLTYARREIMDHSSSSSTLMADAFRVPLYYRQRDDQGRFLTNDILQEFNSLGILEEGGFRRNQDDNVFGTIMGELEVTDFLKIKGVFGANMFSNHQYARTKQVDFYPRGVYGATRNTNDISRKGLDLNTQLMAEFNKQFADVHNVNFLVGVSNENHTSRGFSLYKTFTDPDLGTPITETVIQPNSNNSNIGAAENSLNSLFGRTSYSYQDKYFAEASFRYDGSSRFSQQARWGFFPSMSVGYRLTEEAFLAGYQQKYGDIKFRSSYGVLGNQNVGNYQYQTTFFTFQNAYGFNDLPVGGTGYNYANPDIRWERAATFNVGVDLDFFDGALNLSLDYFDKVTSDILIPPAVPGVFGTGLPDFNSGKVGNRGWEITAGYQHQGRVLGHAVTFNLGDTRNVVLDFQGEQRLTGLEELQVLLREGYPFNSYVGLKRDGFFQTIEELEAGPRPVGLNPQIGDNRYVDVDGDGVIDDNDLYVFGNPFPRLTFGFTYNLSYKGFDLNIFAQGVGRRTMMIRGELVEPFHFNYGMTMYSHQMDFWTPQNPDAYYPRLANNGTQSNDNNFRRGSDMYLFDGSYLRLKNLQIGYTLPKAISQKAGMQVCRAYVSGQNLFTLARVNFVDPELSEFNSNLQSGGANSGRAYPTLVYYGFGLDITF